MTGSLDDVWPTIDDALVETIVQLVQGPQPGQRPAGQDFKVERSTAVSSPRVSESAAKVLDKLERRNQWGGNQVNLDTLRNHFCQGVPRVDEAIEELLDQGLLLSGGHRKGPFSLDTRRKGEIDAIVNQLRQGSSSGDPGRLPSGQR